MFAIDSRTKSFYRASLISTALRYLHFFPISRPKLITVIAVLKFRGVQHTLICERILMDKRIGFFFHQKSFITNKMHQIYVRPPTPLGSSRRSPNPLVGWERGYPSPFLTLPLDAYTASPSRHLRRLFLSPLEHVPLYPLKMSLKRYFLNSRLRIALTSVSAVYIGTPRHAAPWCSKWIVQLTLAVVCFRHKKTGNMWHWSSIECFSGCLVPSVS